MEVTADDVAHSGTSDPDRTDQNDWDPDLGGGWLDGCKVAAVERLGVDLEGAG